MIYQNIVNFSKGWADIDSDTNTLVQGFVYRGEIGKVLLGEAVSRGDFLYPVVASLATVAEWKKCDADAASSMPVLAMALEDGADAQRIKVIFGGFIKNTDWNFGTYATGTITTTGIPVNGETITISGVVFEVTEGEDIASTSDYAIDCTAAMDQATFETALTTAIATAITDNALSMSQSAWSTHVLTLTSTLKGYEGNNETLAEDCTNATVSGANFTGGVEGGVLYASCTAGEVTLTAPSGSGDQVQVVGFALEAEKIMFKPNFDMTEVS